MGCSDELIFEQINILCLSGVNKIFISAIENCGSL